MVCLRPFSQESGQTGLQCWPPFMLELVPFPPNDTSSKEPSLIIHAPPPRSQRCVIHCTRTALEPSDLWFSSHTRPRPPTAFLAAHQLLDRGGHGFLAISFNFVQTPGEHLASRPPLILYSVFSKILSERECLIISLFVCWFVKKKSDGTCQMYFL